MFREKGQIHFNKNPAWTVFDNEQKLTNTFLLYLCKNEKNQQPV